MGISDICTAISVPLHRLAPLTPRELPRKSQLNLPFVAAPPSGVTALGGRAYGDGGADLERAAFGFGGDNVFDLARRAFGDD